MQFEVETAYPADLVAEVLLADGKTGTVRPIYSDDAAQLRALHNSLSDESLYLRFFSPRRTISDAEVEHFVSVDYYDRLALVMIVGGELVAVARYDRSHDAEDAEVAFTVRDDQQGRGIATILLEHLASGAAARGVRRFVADTLLQNRRMLDVFRHSGFAEQTSAEAGVVRIFMDLEPSPTYVDRVEDRERRAAVASIARLLRPASVAVIGASRREGTIGRQLLANLVSGGYQGRIYPVNPAGGDIAGLKAYETVDALPEVPDIAVIAVPAEHVLSVVQACGRRGVGGLVVVSAGFAEVGGPGIAAERELVSTARQFGMRLIGPNCMGVVNTSSDVLLNATFSPVAPIRGPIAFASQSGGLGIAILDEVGRRGLGVSSFVSVGNKADVSGNDLLRYWEDDDATKVVLLYLESFGNPRQFARIARRVTRKKPVVAVKSGHSSAGSRGALSHTAAMATPDATVDALFRQAGVIRVATLEELFDVAELLAHQPLPRGRRIAVVGNAGGPGVLAADACEGHGLLVPELSDATKASLRSILSPAAAVANPVDCIASATPEQYRQALEIVLADDGIDAAIVIFTPPLVSKADDVAAAVASVAARSEKPIVANFFAASGALSALRNGPRRVPWFAYPESAARALAHVVPYASWKDRPDVQAPDYPEIDVAEARSLVEAVLQSDGPAVPDGDAEAAESGPLGPAVESLSGGWLGPSDAQRILNAYGIPSIPAYQATSVATAVSAAAQLGLPVALKIRAPGVVHKTDVGGVRLGLSSQDEVAEAAADLLSGWGGDPAVGLTVQSMAPAGVETIVGVLEDPFFGPVVMFGLGGTVTEILGDRALSLVPVTRQEAVAIIGSLRSAPLLAGYRSAPPADINALADVICRVARLAEDLPEVVEMDLNPVLASPHGCFVLDCKIRVQAQSSPEPRLRRRHLRSAPDESFVSSANPDSSVELVHRGNARPGPAGDP